MKKRYALFPGCLMPTEQYAYELSLRETLPLLGVELVDVEGFSCCGEPMKSVNQLLTLYLSARNLPIAQKHHLAIYVPCAMCHLALTECQHILEKNPAMKERINGMLAAVQQLQCVSLHCDIHGVSPTQCCRINEETILDDQRVRGDADVPSSS